MARKQMSEAEQVDAFFAKIEKQNQERDAKVKVTQEDVVKEAKFLLDWAKSKEVVIDLNMTNYYRCGKYMSKILPKVVDAMLEQGLITGSKTRFKMNKAAVKALG